MHQVYSAEIVFSEEHIVGGRDDYRKKEIFKTIYFSLLTFELVSRSADHRDSVVDEARRNNQIKVTIRSTKSLKSTIF